MDRPAGVTAIAVIFFATAAFLLLVAFALLASPGAVSLTLAAPLLFGLELAGPYMFLLTGAIAALIAFGLLRLNIWARRAAIFISFFGAFMLVPAVSAAATDFRLSLFTTGFGIIVRVVMIWYLYQPPVSERFTNSAKST